VPNIPCRQKLEEMKEKLNNIGTVIKQQRVMSELTLRQLSDKSGVSPSHLGRIERGERLPSAHTLRKIAKPLGFQEEALLVYAGYLSPRSASEGNSQLQDILGGLDPYVARVLSQEPVELQRMVVAILTILKSVA
jgi:transcriptional regulator with XRE-family HTH domain